MKTLRSLLLTLAAVALPACFQVEYGLTLERDLSGTTDLDMTLDLEQMAYAMARLQRGFAGQEGPPTEDEVEAAIAEIRAQMDSGMLREESLREQVAADLPEGVEVVHAVQRRDDLRMSVDLALRFDHISRLNEMEVGSQATGEEEARPFGGLRLVDDGDTFVLRNEPINPLEQARRNAALLEDSDGFIDAMFRDLRIAFSIRAPFEVVEHNATRREGDRLMWTYDYEAMKGGRPQDVFVRYRK